jgi:cytochrome c oxidase subunit 2
MFAQLSLLPEQASTAAVKVDGLFLFLLALTGGISLLVGTLVIYFSIRYRRREPDEIPPHIHGSTRLELVWTIIPTILGLAIFVWGVDVFMYIVNPPPNSLDVYVVAKQWMWKIQHRDGQREINELHVPVGQPVRITLTSEDVIHSFSVPAFRMKVDAVPGRYVHTWFQAIKTGRYHLFCSQYCGMNHSGMVGTVIVQTPEEYQDWLSSHAEGSPALDGRKVFLQYQCASCHSATALARAPVLEGIYGQSVPLTDGRTVVADDDYLRESIVNPQAKIVAGYGPIMPSYQGQISEEDILKLLTFIRTLKPGQTPPRIDDAPPPSVQEDKPNATKKL